MTPIDDPSRDEAIQRAYENAIKRTPQQNAAYDTPSGDVPATAPVGQYSAPRMGTLAEMLQRSLGKSFKVRVVGELSGKNRYGDERKYLRFGITHGNDREMLIDLRNVEIEGEVVPSAVSIGREAVPLIGLRQGGTVGESPEALYTGQSYKAKGTKHYTIIDPVEQVSNIIKGTFEAYEEVPYLSQYGKGPTEILRTIMATGRPSKELDIIREKHHITASSGINYGVQTRNFLEAISRRIPIYRPSSTTPWAESGEIRRSLPYMYPRMTSPGYYDAESGTIHTVSSFRYRNEELEAYVPRGGKISKVTGEPSKAALLKYIKQEPTVMKGRENVVPVVEEFDARIRRKVWRPLQSPTVDELFADASTFGEQVARKGSILVRVGSETLLVNPTLMTLTPQSAGGGFVAVGAMPQATQKRGIPQSPILWTTQGTESIPLPWENNQQFNQAIRAIEAGGKGKLLSIPEATGKTTAANARRGVYLGTAAKILNGKLVYEPIYDEPKAYDMKVSEVTVVVPPYVNKNTGEFAGVVPLNAQEGEWVETKELQKILKQNLGVGVGMEVSAINKPFINVTRAGRVSVTGKQSGVKEGTISEGIRDWVFKVAGGIEARVMRISQEPKDYGEVFTSAWEIQPLENKLLMLDMIDTRLTKVVKKDLATHVIDDRHLTPKYIAQKYTELVSGTTTVSNFTAQELIMKPFMRLINETDQAKQIENYKRYGVFTIDDSTQLAAGRIESAESVRVFKKNYFRETGHEPEVDGIVFEPLNSGAEPTFRVKFPIVKRSFGLIRGIRQNIEYPQGGGELPSLAVQKFNELFPDSAGALGILSSMGVSSRTVTPSTQAWIDLVQADKMQQDALKGKIYLTPNSIKIDMAMAQRIKNELKISLSDLALKPVTELQLRDVIKVLQKVTGTNADPGVLFFENTLGYLPSPKAPIHLDEFNKATGGSTTGIARSWLGAFIDLLEQESIGSPSGGSGYRKWLSFESNMIGTGNDANKGLAKIEVRGEQSVNYAVLNVLGANEGAIPDKALEDWAEKQPGVETPADKAALLKRVRELGYVPDFFTRIPEEGTWQPRYMLTAAEVKRKYGININEDSSVTAGLVFVNQYQHETSPGDEDVDKGIHVGGLAVTHDANGNPVVVDMVTGLPDWQREIKRGSEYYIKQFEESVGGDPDKIHDLSHSSQNFRAYAEALKTGYGPIFEKASDLGYVRMEALNQVAELWGKIMVRRGTSYNTIRLIEEIGATLGISQSMMQKALGSYGFLTTQSSVEATPKAAISTPGELRHLSMKQKAGGLVIKMMTPRQGEGLEGQFEWKTIVHPNATVSPRELMFMEFLNSFAESDASNEAIAGLFGMRGGEFSAQDYDELMEILKDKKGSARSSAIFENQEFLKNLMNRDTIANRMLNAMVIAKQMGMSNNELAEMFEVPEEFIGGNASKTIEILSSLRTGVDLRKFSITDLVNAAESMPPGSPQYDQLMGVIKSLGIDTMTIVPLSETKTVDQLRRRFEKGMTSMRASDFSYIAAGMSSDKLANLKKSKLFYSKTIEMASEFFAQMFDMPNFGEVVDKAAESDVIEAGKQWEKLLRKKKSFELGMGIGKGMSITGTVAGVEIRAVPDFMKVENGKLIITEAKSGGELSRQAALWQATANKFALMSKYRVDPEGVRRRLEEYKKRYDEWQATEEGKGTFMQEDFVDLAMDALEREDVEARSYHLNLSTGNVTISRSDITEEDFSKKLKDVQSFLKLHAPHLVPDLEKLVSGKILHVEDRDRSVIKAAKEFAMPKGILQTLLKVFHGAGWQKEGAVSSGSPSADEIRKNVEKAIEEIKQGKRFGSYLEAMNYLEKAGLRADAFSPAERNEFFGAVEKATGAASTIISTTEVNKEPGKGVVGKDAGQLIDASTFSPVFEGLEGNAPGKPAFIFAPIGTINRKERHMGRMAALDRILELEYNRPDRIASKKGGIDPRSPYYERYQNIIRGIERNYNRNFGVGMEGEEIVPAQSAQVPSQSTARPKGTSSGNSSDDLIPSNFPENEDFGGGNRGGGGERPRTAAASDDKPPARPFSRALAYRNVAIGRAIISRVGQLKYHSAGFLGTLSPEELARIPSLQKISPDERAAAIQRAPIETALEYLSTATPESLIRTGQSVKGGEFLTAVSRAQVALNASPVARGIGYKDWAERLKVSTNLPESVRNELLNLAKEGGPIYSARQLAQGLEEQSKIYGFDIKDKKAKRGGTGAGGTSFPEGGFSRESFKERATSLDSLTQGITELSKAVTNTTGEVGKSVKVWTNLKDAVSNTQVDTAFKNLQSVFENLGIQVPQGKGILGYLKAGATKAEQLKEAGLAGDVGAQRQYDVLSSRMGKLYTATDKYSRRLAAAELQEEINLQREAPDVGHIARRALGGFGVMYLRSMWGLATEGLGGGAQPAVALRTQMAQQTAAASGIGIPYMSGSEKAQIMAGLYGGENVVGSAFSQLTAGGIGREARGAISMGIGAFAASEWLGDIMGKKNAMGRWLMGVNERGNTVGIPGGMKVAGAAMLLGLGADIANQMQTPESLAFKKARAESNLANISASVGFADILMGSDEEYIKQKRIARAALATAGETNIVGRAKMGWELAVPEETVLGTMQKATGQTGMATAMAQAIPAWASAQIALHPETQPVAAEVLGFMAQNGIRNEDYLKLAHQWGYGLANQQNLTAMGQVFGYNLSAMNQGGMMGTQMMELANMQIPSQQAAIIQQGLQFGASLGAYGSTLGLSTTNQWVQQARQWAPYAGTYAGQIYANSVQTYMASLGGTAEAQPLKPPTTMLSTRMREYPVEVPGYYARRDEKGDLVRYPYTQREIDYFRKPGQTQPYGLTWVPGTTAIEKRQVMEQVPMPAQYLRPWEMATGVNAMLQQSWQNALFAGVAMPAPSYITQAQMESNYYTVQQLEGLQRQAGIQQQYTGTQAGVAQQIIANLERANVPLSAAQRAVIETGGTKGEINLSYTQSLVEARTNLQALGAPVQGRGASLYVYGREGLYEGPTGGRRPPIPGAGDLASMQRFAYQTRVASNISLAGLQGAVEKGYITREEANQLGVKLSYSSAKQFDIATGMFGLEPTAYGRFAEQPGGREALQQLFGGTFLSRTGAEVPGWKLGLALSPGMSQPNGPNEPGVMNGFAWGQYSLATTSDTAITMARRIFGDTWTQRANGQFAFNDTTGAFGTRGPEAMVNGFQIPGTNIKIPGIEGARLSGSYLSYEATMASVGNQLQSIALNKAFTTGVGIQQYAGIVNPQTGSPFGFNTGPTSFNVPGIGGFTSQGGGFWGVQDAMRALGNLQQGWQLQMQQQGMQIQRGQFYENMGMNVRQAGMQRQWAQQDWQYQDQTRQMQWGWRQEDFQENVRFMTGRERRLAERQMRRETTMFGVEGDQISKQRDRQKELWKLEDERFLLQKKQFEESFVFQEKQLEGARLFFEERKKMEEENIAMQRAYWTESIKLQEQAAGTAAYYAEQQLLLSTAIAAVQFASDDAKTALASMDEDALKAIGLDLGVNGPTTNGLNRFMQFLANIATWKPPKTDEPDTPIAGQGSPNKVDGYTEQCPKCHLWFPPGVIEAHIQDCGKAAGVNEWAFGPKVFVAGEGALPEKVEVTPLGQGTYRSRWQDTAIPAQESVTVESSKPGVINIYIGNKKLKTFILDTVNEDLEV